MATAPKNPSLKGKTPFSGVGAPVCPESPSIISSLSTDHFVPDHSPQKPSRRNALQALLAFSALHEQMRRRRTPASRETGSEADVPVAEVEEGEQFDLDEVLQLVADSAVAMTGADGVAIALAENNEIVLRAAAGTVRPDLGARIDRDSAFSGACFRTAQIVNCDDTETDARVNLQACRQLGARSMVAVPLCGRERVIGLLEVFSEEPFGFNDSDVHNLSLLAGLVLGALKREEEDRFAESAQVAATKLSVDPAQAALIVLAKPQGKEVASTPAILHGPAFEPENTYPFESAITTEAAAQPEAPVEEPASPTRQPTSLVLLMCVAIVAAFAGGIWLDLKTARLRSVRTRMADTAPKPLVITAKARKVPSSPDASAAVNSSSVNPERILSGGQASNAPAKPQKLPLSKFPRVTGIQHWSSADSSSVVLNLEDPVQYEAHRLTRPDRIYFDLHATQLVSDLAWKSIEVNDALLNRIRLAQPVAGMTRVALDTKGHPDFSVSLEPNPYRLVIEVRKIAANP